MTCADKIQHIRKEMGEDLLILAHHYQPNDIMPFVDCTGDSLELSRIAAQSKAKRIVFCGVRFMAETADILVRDAEGFSNDRLVFLPAPEAGCPMADMATADALQAAWHHLRKADPQSKLVPLVYVNSSAQVKAFCGQHHGSSCTSGNGTEVVKHYIDKGYKIFFAPDQYLCSNIMHDLGYGDEVVVRYSPDLTDEAIQNATLIAWPGCCPIHQKYTREDVEAHRAKDPHVQIMVHPESTESVTRAADHHGSTKDIINWIRTVPPTTHCVIGTEQKLVKRLMATYPERKIEPLKPIFCPDMALTTPERLLHVLENWPTETLVHVDDALVKDAKACVEQMLAL